MVTLLGYDDVVTTLKADDATVDALVRRAPRGRLVERSFGEWSVVEVLEHVAYIAEVMRGRIERAPAEDGPAIPAVPDGALADERDPVVLARCLQVAHAAILDLLMEPDAPERPTTHAEWERVNAGHFAAHHTQHGDDHIDELAWAFLSR